MPSLTFFDQVYIAGVIYFALNCALASIGAFLPTIITTFGYTRAASQLLTVPPYVVSAIVMVSFCLTSDRIQSRGIPMAVSTFIGAIGYLYGIFCRPAEGAILISSFFQASTYSPQQPACTLFCHILHHERYVHNCRANHRLV